MKAISADLHTMLQNGALTVNEARELAGLPAIEEAKSVMVRIHELVASFYEKHGFSPNVLRVGTEALSEIQQSVIISAMPADPSKFLINGMDVVLDNLLAPNTIMATGKRAGGMTYAFVDEALPPKVYGHSKLESIEKELAILQAKNDAMMQIMIDQAALALPKKVILDPVKPSMTATAAQQMSEEVKAAGAEISKNAGKAIQKILKDAFADNDDDIMDALNFAAPSSNLEQAPKLTPEILELIKNMQALQVKFPLQTINVDAAAAPSPDWDAMSFAAPGSDWAKIQSVGQRAAAEAKEPNPELPVMDFKARRKIRVQP